MAIRIDSNTDTDEELRAMLADLGAVDINGANGTALAEPKRAVEEKKEQSAPEGKLGEKPAEAPADGTAAGTEPAKPQEPPAGETEEEKTKREKAKGGWQRSIEKKTAQIEHLKDQLEEERGDRTRLKARLDELEAQLEELKGGQAAEEPKETGPVKPKRPEMPELSDFEFDADKFAAAMKEYRKAAAKYEDDMGLYFEALAEQKAEQKVLAAETARREEAVAAAQAERENAFVERRDGGKKLIEDFDEVMDAVPANEPMFFDMDIPGPGMLSVAAHYVKFESDAPAELMYYFAKDHLENDGAEGERLLALSPTKRVIELRKIEDRLVQERKALINPPKKEEPKAAAAAPKEPPAPPKPTRKAPDEPIEPVGAHSVTANPGNLDEQLRAASEAGDFREVRRIRELQKKQLTAGRA